MTNGLKVGSGCSFYHEGGKGEKRWVIGWRFGRIIEIGGDKGKYKGQVRVEIPVKLWERDAVTNRYKSLPNEKVWVREEDVNEVGDFTYHGTRTVEMIKEEVKERKEEKIKQQEKVERMKRKGRLK